VVFNSVSFKIQRQYEDLQVLNILLILIASLIFINFINFIIFNLLYFKKIKQAARKKVIIFSFVIFLFSCLFYINSQATNRDSSSYNEKFDTFFK